MESLTAEDQKQVVESLQSEVTRLESLLREYQTARKPQNAVIKQMADEGWACRQEKLGRLRALLAKLTPKPESPRRVM
jgi:hypothetical protein